MAAKWSTPAGTWGQGVGEGPQEAMSAAVNSEGA